MGRSSVLYTYIACALVPTAADDGDVREDSVPLLPVTNLLGGTESFER